MKANCYFHSTGGAIDVPAAYTVKNLRLKSPSRCNTGRSSATGSGNKTELERSPKERQL